MFLFLASQYTHILVYYLLFEMEYYQKITFLISHSNYFHYLGDLSHYQKVLYSPFLCYVSFTYESFLYFVFIFFSNTSYHLL